MVKSVVFGHAQLGYARIKTLAPTRSEIGVGIDDQGRATKYFDMLSPNMQELKLYNQTEATEHNAR